MAFQKVDLHGYDLVLCDTWNWSHDNVSGIKYHNTITIPEVHMKR